MENKIYLLYETDAWHGRDSFVLMGIFTSLEWLADGVREIVAERYSFDKANFKPSRGERKAETIERVCDEFFSCGLQTQGYQTNLYATEVTPNIVGEI